MKKSTKKPSQAAQKRAQRSKTALLKRSLNSRNTLKKKKLQNKIQAGRSAKTRLAQQSKDQSQESSSPVNFTQSRSFCELPPAYGDNKAVLLVRDPWWLYAYWEVTPEQRSRVIEKMRSESRTPDKTVIRVYDVTDSTTTDSANYFDIELNFFADNWYIDVGKPDRAWVMEIGLRTRDGYFYPLVRSNTVRTPRHTISDVLDEEWLLPDDLYWKIYGLPADGRKSSADLREFLDKYLRQVGSSENVPAKQAASPPSEKR